MTFTPWLFMKKNWWLFSTSFPYNSTRVFSYISKTVTGKFGSGKFGPSKFGPGKFGPGEFGPRYKC